MRKAGGRPTTVKGIFKELVEVCEECGGRNFQIATYEIFEGARQRKGFMASLGEHLVPADADEYNREMRRRNDENRRGIEVEYYCSYCAAEFVQFYSDSAFSAFRESFEARYSKK